MRKISMFVVLYVVWCLLVFPYDRTTGQWDTQSLLVGLVAALVVVVLFGNALPDRSCFLLAPRRWFWALVYIPFFAYYCLKANLEVAYLVLHPDMPIRPGIVKVRTSLRTRVAITALANSITLTPGTLTVDADEDGTLYVHWIDVKFAEDDEATREIVSRFEGHLRRIFE
ncbi:MAG: Na+/H+ antiporter subunit E [Planctomycetes bacterium]|nr:Na+/H+ antiporter subunit E [Planctomycetota bacterium]